MIAVTIFSIILFGIIIFLIIRTLTKSFKFFAKNNKVQIDNNKVLEYKNLIDNNKSLKTTDKIRAFILILLLICVVIIIIVFLNKINPIFIIILTVILSIIYIVINAKYTKDFKISIVSEALKHYDANLSYNPSLGIPRNDYIYADFENFDRYASEDLISGNILNCPFIMSDVKTEIVEKDNEGRTNYITVFSGVVAKINLNKNINSFIYIINNSLRLFDGKYKINIDNESFTQRYDTYSDNEVLTMRILTPNVTTSILDMENKTGIKFEIKISNDIIFFRFYTNDLFYAGQSTQKSAENLVYSIELIDDMKNIIASILEVLQDTEV